MRLPSDFYMGMEFNGPTWKVLKLWLEEKKETKTNMLIGADTHDQSNQIRGALMMLNEILALEKAAAMAAQNGNNR